MIEHKNNSKQFISDTRLSFRWPWAFIYILIPLLATLSVTILFYPGFMSFDTLHALQGARSEVTDSMWPPMVSYVWRAVDFISENPAAMHFAQVFLLIISIFFIVFSYTRKVIYPAIFFLIYFSVPAVLGTLAVIWKDVLMAAFFLGGFVTILWMKKMNSKGYFYSLAFLAVMFIFLGTCSRHNAITAAIPLLFCWAYLVIHFSSSGKSLRLWIGTLFLGLVVISAVFVSKTFLDKYSLPSLTKLPESASTFIQTVRALDIAGASVCVGENLFSDVAPDLSMDEIMRTYDPRHINLSGKLLGQLNLERGVGINRVWMNVAMEHPFCFFNNKFQLTKFMVGADTATQFLITAPSIDQNEYGYALAESKYRDAAVTYIVKSADLFFYKPWFIYVLFILAFIYLMHTKLLTIVEFSILSSAVFYLGGLVAFGNAADARLLFYTTTVFLMYTFIALIKFITRPK